MQLNLERPDYQYFLRGADGASALVNDRRLSSSFVVAPNSLVEDWPVSDVASMMPSDLDTLLALEPELLVIGTGAIQKFPPAAVMAASLQRGIGIEVMTNAAAARTYSVLAGEGRRVAAGFVFPG
ncbi:Mth938-like domain-containing protein [Thermomonas sp.]|uniref:Mth938-like domain-containing protein n=1 Tax=Thermomonas sp. TaxID=1971895 RepID=UPI00248A7802|nr:Mth938-like domain-containing protein [Thermomonas sp.]MDI1253899.1 Mth938-like domain-containing protein [Thermomonas sp.]